MAEGFPRVTTTDWDDIRLGGQARTGVPGDEDADKDKKKNKLGVHPWDVEKDTGAVIWLDAVNSDDDKIARDAERWAERIIDTETGSRALRYFTTYKIDGTKVPEKKLAQWHVKSLPALLFTDHEGNPVKVVTRLGGANNLVRETEAIMKHAFAKQWREVLIERHRIEQLYDRGCDLMRDDRFEEARKCFEEVVESDEHTDVYYKAMDRLEECEEECGGR